MGNGCPLRFYSLGFGTLCTGISVSENSLKFCTLQYWVTKWSRSDSFNLPPPKQRPFPSPFYLQSRRLLSFSALRLVAFPLQRRETSRRPDAARKMPSPPLRPSPQVSKPTRCQSPLRAAQWRPSPNSEKQFSFPPLK